MKKGKQQSDYTLRRRYFNQIGQPLDWVDKGHGLFQEIETVQNQIMMLSKCCRKVEIEFILKGKKCGFDGKEIKGNLIYHEK